MEGAGKLVDDEELREAMSERGLGTPATRAAIIEGLLNESYLRREGRDLVPTAKARQLMTLLSGLDVTELTSPELTGEWEHKLKQIEQGGLGREAFMREIAQMTQVIVKRAKEYERDTVPGDYATLRTPCPKCGAVVRKTTGALPAPAAISRSANTRAGAPSNCRKSRNCWPSARSARCKASSARWAGPSPPSCASATRTSWNSTSARTTRTTPKPWTSPATRRSAPAPCSSRVFEHGMSYVCEKSVGPARTCDFRSGKVILQQEISREQMEKLLTEGRTGLLDGFVSSRTNRKFKAFLVRQPDGKIGFEFEPRPEKPPRAGQDGQQDGGDQDRHQDGHENGRQESPAKKAAVKKTATKTAAKKTAKKTAA